MKRFISLLALVALAALPARAGVAVSVHIGGSGGYHGYCGSSYGGHGCYGGSNAYHGYYGGYGYGIPSYGVVSYGSYGYAPSYVSYGTPVDYGYSAGSYPTTYAPVETPPPAPAPQSAVAQTVSPTALSLPLGKVDDAGFVHSPFTNTAFKVDTYANGQTFFDPVTGQAFTVHKSDASTKAAAPAASMPTGRIDEFGYVHSPYSTYFVKLRSDVSSQVYHDPNTGQFFTVIPKATAQQQHIVSAQVVD